MLNIEREQIFCPPKKTNTNNSSTSKNEQRELIHNTINLLMKQVIKKRIKPNQNNSLSAHQKFQAPPIKLDNDLDLTLISDNLQQIQKKQLELEQYVEVLEFNNKTLRKKIDTHEETIKKLKQQNQKKNHFLGIASHDLRTPLSAIIGYAKLLLSSVMGELEPSQKHLINRIENSSEFMLKLVNDLLDFTAGENGQIALQKQYVDIITLLEGVINQVNMIANKKNIQIELLPCKQIPKIKLAPHKIEQVLHNILSNACKFSKAQTTIRVFVLQSNDKLLLNIEDQGQGIPEEEISQLFEPFRKTSTKTTNGEKSTGLGLAIVKQIIDSHKGKIRVKSKLNQGTTFMIELPLIN